MSTDQPWSVERGERDQYWLNFGHEFHDGWSSDGGHCVSCTQTYSDRTCRWAFVRAKTPGYQTLCTHEDAAALRASFNACLNGCRTLFAVLTHCITRQPVFSKHPGDFATRRSDDLHDNFARIDQQCSTARPLDRFTKPPVAPHVILCARRHYSCH
jgi:hypothetical protein